MPLLPPWHIRIAETDCVFWRLCAPQDDSRRCNLLTQFCRVMVRDFQLAIPRVLSFVDLEAARLVHGHPISPAGRARVISSVEAMRHTRVKLTVETAVEHQSSADDLDGGGGKMQGVDTCVIWGATADFGPQSGRLDRVRVCAIEAEGAVRYRLRLPSHSFWQHTR